MTRPQQLSTFRILQLPPGAVAALTGLLLIAGMILLTHLAR
ncbi:hypothetical protein [Nocardia inohanensis]|nr:hypothetical protein [Nocardia inohanensis]